MVDFTMGFADMNKWFLSYENPTNDLERSINEHTFEDRTHSRLFLENWHALGLDERLGWSTSQTLWWLYHSPQTLPVRRFGWDILRLAVQFPDPLVRFALMESIEICGDVFFRNTARIATQLSRHTGIEYRYYGEHHQLRETGHLHTDESPFFAARLSDTQHAAAQRVAQHIFSGFRRILDHLLGLCRGETLGFALANDVLEHSRVAMLPSTGLIRARASASVPAVGKTQAPLFDFLSERRAQLAGHPFLAWLRDPKIDGIQKLRGFSPLWAIDIAGYRDFTELALTYPSPGNAEEHAINRWADQLASHGVLYLQDWQALGLDQTLNWTSGEAIGFYFLSEQTEVHRKNLAKITRYAFRDSEPVLRFWLMTAFEAGGDPLFDALAPVIAEAELAVGPLNYWAERHCNGASPFGSDDAQRQLARLLTLDLSAQQQHCISEMISAVFDNLEEQFTLSHQLVIRGAFLTAPRSLVPTVQAAPRVTSSFHTAPNPSAE